MYDDRYLLAGSGIAILAGIALLATSGALGALVSLDSPSMTGSELAAFEATSPHCANPGRDNGSVTAGEVAGGTQLHVDRTVPVPSRNTDVNATFEQVGPHRYVLNIRRESEASRGSGTCELVVHYEATVNVTHANRYTVVLTHDDRLRAIYWSGPDTDGVVRQPASNVTATRNRTGTTTE